MEDIKRCFDYRKYYTKVLRTEIPNGYDIHHIDFDRKNNRISNLVMIPTELHNKYHKLLLELNVQFSLNKNLCGILDGGNGINNYIKFYQIPKMLEFIECWEEASKYIDYRDYLLDKMANIHNIEVDYE